MKRTPGWRRDSARHSLASRGVRTRRQSPIKSLGFDVRSGQFDGDVSRQIEIMTDYFRAIARSNPDGTVTLYRGTDEREASDALLYARKGWPYTMYGRWWSTDPREARNYALTGAHYDRSGKWTLLAMDVPFTMLMPGNLDERGTKYDRVTKTFTARFVDGNREVLIEKQGSRKFAGYIVKFDGGRPVDAKTMRVVERGLTI